MMVMLLNWAYCINGWFKAMAASDWFRVFDSSLLTVIFPFLGNLSSFILDVCDSIPCFRISGCFVEYIFPQKEINK